MLASTFIVAALSLGAASPGQSLVIDTVDLKGQAVTAKSLKGKVVVVDFWASWCKPCAKSLPVYSELQKKYADQGLEIIAVSIDDELENVQRYLKDHKLGLRFVHDKDKSLVGRFEPPKMPTAYIVDREGTIRVVHGGWGDGDAKHFEADLLKYLGKKTK